LTLYGIFARLQGALVFDDWMWLLGGWNANDKKLPAHLQQ